MTSKEFYETVKQMRDAQKKYFRTRDIETLKISKHLESVIDKEIKRVEDIINYPKLKFTESNEKEE